MGERELKENAEKARMHSYSTFMRLEIDRKTGKMAPNMAKRKGKEGNKGDFNGDLNPFSTSYQFQL